eukprot:6209653-Pleurochrysis_carterae.AAC.8
MEDGTLQPLVDVCLSCSMVWTRMRKRLIVQFIRLRKYEFPRGLARQSVRKPPYPIPHKCTVQTVRAEIDGLLKAGLIEPGFSNCCSPVLCVIKKDTAKGATGKDIKLKLAVDFRKLNAATELDTGSLGDQGDILETFHNRPYNSLAATRLEHIISVGSTPTCYLRRVGIRLSYGASHLMAGQICLQFTVEPCGTSVEVYRIMIWVNQSRGEEKIDVNCDCLPRSCIVEQLA